MAEHEDGKVGNVQIAAFLHSPQDERVLLVAVVRRAGRVAVAGVVTSTEMFDSLEVEASRSIHADLREAVIEAAR
jgi:hypothetical protein